MRGHRHPQVEPIDEADAVGRQIAPAAVVERDLREAGGGRAAEAGAREAAGAVACGAGEAAIGAADAAGTGPYATRPGASRRGKGAVRKGGEEEAATFKDVAAGVRLDGRPQREGAVVHHRQVHRRELRRRLLRHEEDRQEEEREEHRKGGGGSHGRELAVQQKEANRKNL